MNDKLELLEAFLKGWQSVNERRATERIASEFLSGQMDAIDRIKLQIQKLKEDEDSSELNG
jgi:hypothetical protein